MFVHFPGAKAQAVQWEQCTSVKPKRSCVHNCDQMQCLYVQFSGISAGSPECAACFEGSVGVIVTPVS